MKNDETSRCDEEAFEQRLRQQSIKKIPTEWRAEILRASRDIVTPEHATRNTHSSLFSTFNYQLSTLLWSHPKAWAGLAALWILIIVLNFECRDETQTSAAKSPAPSPEMMVALREQHQLFAELVGRSEPQDAERPKVVIPQPRSERRIELFAA